MSKKTWRREKEEDWENLSIFRACIYFPKLLTFNKVQEKPNGEGKIESLQGGIMGAIVTFIIKTKTQGIKDTYETRTRYGSDAVRKLHLRN